MILRNIYTQETVIPSRIGNRDNVTWENSQDILLPAGWRVMPEPPEVAEGYTRIFSATPIEGDGINGQWLCVDRLTSEIEAERKAQELLENGERWAYENAYLTMCDQLTGGTEHVKLGFAELQTIITNMQATDPMTAMTLALQLLTLNAALVRCGGTLWWDNCTWHPEVAT